MVRTDGAIRLADQAPETNLMHVGQGPMDFRDVLSAENIPYTDGQMHRIAKRKNHRFDLLGPFAQCPKRRFETSVIRDALEHERIEKIIDHPRIAQENLHQIRTRATEPDVQVHEQGMAREQLPKDPFASEGLPCSDDVSQRQIRTWCLCNSLDKRIDDPRKMVSAIPRRKGCNLLLGTLLEHLLGT